MQISAFGPFAARMYAQFENLENEYLKQNTQYLSLTGTGLWLRQGNKDHQEVIHARVVHDGGKRLKRVTIYEYQNISNYVGRIDAEEAILRDGFWFLKFARVSRPNEPLKIQSVYRIPTTLDSQKISDSFSSEDTLSFWVLPQFIKTLEDAGFDASNHKMKLHSLLAIPFIFCAMVMIAATFSMRVSHRRSAAYLILLGIGCGFLLYFFTNIVHALGLSTNIPIWVSAWTPALVSLLIGVSALLHTEDG